MANFPTHVTTSAVLGASYGAAAHMAYDVPLPACLLSGGLCTIAGLLPDVDSDNAVILREILAFVAAVIPMLLLGRFRELQWSQETIIVASGLIYIIIRFGIGEMIRRGTTHRGMWHSLPAAAATSLVVYFLCASPDVRMRLFKTSAFALGFLWHLVLDEIYSVETTSGRVRVKRSFGTALKMFGKSPVGNIATYGALFGMIYLLLAAPPALPLPWYPVPQSQLTPVPDPTATDDGPTDDSHSESVHPDDYVSPGYVPPQSPYEYLPAGQN